MARYDLNKPADREAVRLHATSPAHRDHPLAKVLVAALDLVETNAREAFGRAKADADRRLTNELWRGGDDPFARLFG